MQASAYIARSASTWGVVARLTGPGFSPVMGSPDAFQAAEAELGARPLREAGFWPD